MCAEISNAWGIHRGPRRSEQPKGTDVWAEAWARIGKDTRAEAAGTAKEHR
jgi:hypothetical protein